MKKKTESSNGLLKKFIVARLDKPVGLLLSVRKGNVASNTTSGTTCTMIRR